MGFFLFLRDLPRPVARVPPTLANFIFMTFMRSALGFYWFPSFPRRFSFVFGQTSLAWFMGGFLWIFFALCLQFPYPLIPSAPNAVHLALKILPTCHKFYCILTSNKNASHKPKKYGKINNKKKKQTRKCISREIRKYNALDGGKTE